MLALFTSVVAQVNMTPDFSAIPGSGTLNQIVNGLAAVALLLCLAGIIIGGGLWGVGSLSSNFHAATVGKRATLLSVVGALIVGASVALVNWAFSLGTTVG